MTQSSGEPSLAHAAATPADTADARRDPAMRSLYKMSRTAGVGLQDYAAVNPLAVTGLLLAIASGLVILFRDVTGLLVVPLAAIAISAIGFVQVHRSNGTQTGRWIAALGLIIAVGLAGTNIAARASIAATERRTRDEISAVVDRFREAAVAGKMNGAYATFDARFQEAVKQETFDRTLDFRLKNMFGGPAATGMALGERITLETDANGVQSAKALIVVSAPGEAAPGVPYRGEEPAEFRKAGDGWKIRSISNWFAVGKPAPQEQ